MRKANCTRNGCGWKARLTLVDVAGVGLLPRLGALLLLAGGGGGLLASLLLLNGSLASRGLAAGGGSGLGGLGGHFDGLGVDGSVQLSKFEVVLEAVEFDGVGGRGRWSVEMKEKTTVLGDGRGI